MIVNNLLRAGACVTALMALSGAGTSGASGRSGGPGYNIIDLGTLGGPVSAAFGINNLGQVVGGADLANGTRHPFRWENGVMTDLGTPPPFAQCQAQDINNHGVVCGYCCCGAGFVWENGVFTKLPHLTGAQTGDTSAEAINDARQVVGASIALGTGGAQHAFLWENGTMSDLGTLGGSHSVAWDINSAGQVVGKAFTQVAERAFLWEGGMMSDLGTLGGMASEAFDGNEAGQIVGWAQDQPGGKFYQAFLWQGGTMTNLGGIGGFDWSSAEAINNLGTVVGMGMIGQVESGFAYDPALGIRDLADLIPPNSGWTDLNPWDLNDSGQIAGTGTINGARHGFLMTPLPPIPAVSFWGLSALVLALLAVGTVLLRRHGR